MAVLLFFLLSGYWVTKLYYRMGASRVGAFYASRFLRIALLYWLCFGLAALTLNKTIDPLDLILFGVASRSSDPLGVTWSLDVELQFYLALPLLLAVGAKLPAWAATALVAGLTLTGVALVASTGIVTVFQYLPAFAIGIGISLVNWNPERKTAYASLAAFAALSLAFVAIPQTRIMLDSSLPNPIDHDLFAFIWMLPLIPYVAHSLAATSGEGDRHLGNLSYPLYLVHYPIIQLSNQALGPGLQAKIAALACSMVVALLLYWFFDRWTDRYRRAFFERGRLAAAN